MEEIVSNTSKLQLLEKTREIEEQEMNRKSRNEKKKPSKNQSTMIEL